MYNVEEEKLYMNKPGMRSLARNSTLTHKTHLTMTRHKTEAFPSRICVANLTANENKI